MAARKKKKHYRHMSVGQYVQAICDGDHEAVIEVIELLRLNNDPLFPILEARLIEAMHKISAHHDRQDVVLVEWAFLTRFVVDCLKNDAKEKILRLYRRT